MKKMKVVMAGLVVALGVTGTRGAAAAPACAYVVGTIEGRTVTTPAILIVIPDAEADVDGVRVHVDALTLTILGYTVGSPEVDEETQRADVFVVPKKVDGSVAPGHNYYDTKFKMDTCVHFEASTTAVPIYIPASALENPGAVVSIPSVTLTYGNKEVTLPGKRIEFSGQQIVVPEYHGGVSAQYVSSPAYSLIVDLYGFKSHATYLIPPH